MAWQAPLDLLRKVKLALGDAMGPILVALKVFFLLLEGAGLAYGVYRLNDASGKPLSIPEISILDSVTIGAGDIPVSLVIVIVFSILIGITLMWKVEWRDGTRAYAFGADPPKE